jgi:SAM-dependent methyltransferase
MSDPVDLSSAETARIRERYARRTESLHHALYNPLDPAVQLAMQEKERLVAGWLAGTGIPPAEMTLLDVGCGTGDDLLMFLRLGFAPENLAGCELLEDRAAVARTRLPARTRLLCGDVLGLDIGASSYDVVSQSTVFTSLLDDRYQERLAAEMWNIARPGGGILWCDFVYDNPRNPDVRGVGLSRIRELFPGASVKAWRMTLAPPISRRLTKVSPRLYSLFNVFPFLRTHILAWIAKS